MDYLVQVNRWASLRNIVLQLALVASIPTVLVEGHTSSCRNATFWPFSAQSIWNTAIGSGASYVEAHIRLDLNVSHGVMADPEYFVVTSAADPLVPFYDPGSWSERCVGTKAHASQGPQALNLPADWIVSDCQGHNTPNNAAAFLQPDSRTLIQGNPICRNVTGGPVYGYLTPGESHGQYEDLYGTGVTGGHGGSGLSSLGGSIRMGELLPTTGPIQHALKLELYANLYYWLNASDPSHSYRWPAIQCDNYAGQSGPLQYNGSVPSLVPGALLAVRPQDYPALNSTLQTIPGRKIATALLDYGGYIVSDAAWDVRQICVQAAVEAEFLHAYSYNFTSTHFPEPAGPTAWWQDIATIFSYLYVVDNNSPETPGGGGTPRQPSPPPFCDVLQEAK